MHAELQARLEQLGDDLRAGRIDRAALFWLKVFADAAAPEGWLRSDRWVEAGLEAAREVPGLPAAALAPRQDLVARSGLFRFVRLKDDAELSAVALSYHGAKILVSHPDLVFGHTSIAKTIARCFMSGNPLQKAQKRSSYSTLRP